MPDQTRFAWAKLNAYGLILAGLALLSGISDLVEPGGADLARLIGEVPPGQYFWTTAYAIAGILLTYGMIRERFVETLGLALMILALVAQTVVTYALIGWTDLTVTRLITLAILLLGGWARHSVLWPREALLITIPPREDRR